MSWLQVPLITWLCSSVRPWRRLAGLSWKQRDAFLWWVPYSLKTLCFYCPHLQNTIKQHFDRSLSLLWISVGSWWFYLPLLCHIGTREPSFSLWVFGTQAALKWSVYYLQGENVQDSETDFNHKFAKQLTVCDVIWKVYQFICHDRWLSGERGTQK